MENDSFYYIVSGLVSVLCPVKQARAFGSEAEYADYMKTHKKGVLKEKRFQQEDIAQVPDWPQHRRSDLKTSPTP